MGLVITSVVAITVAAVIFYRYILKTLKDTKLKELLEGKRYCNCILFLVDSYLFLPRH